ncbi:hypothetical protein [Pasteurella multocida]|uniref:hypothetical protein n=1 Tax=Pasteurella multocida TaxID=747 RepID=UPI00397B52EF
MSINFTKIFQDSWNFVRNQRQITFTFVFAFFLSNLLISVLITSLSSAEAISQSKANEDLAQVLGMTIVGPSAIFLSFVHHIIYFIISAWCLISIHNISQNNLFSLSTSFSSALQRFLGAFVINILLLTPLLIGLSEVFFSLVVQKSQPSIFSLLSMGLGIYLCIRLCLASVHYLISTASISQSFKITWLAGIKRVARLFLYCLIVYFLLPMVTRQFSLLATNLILETLAALITAFLTVFSLVFTYRFYTIFMQKA